MIITIYTKDNCSFCEKAKTLMTSNGFKYRERNIIDENILYELLSILPEVKTVPQIYIDEKHIGGFSELQEYIKEQR